MGDHIIIETPPNTDKNACGNSYVEPINVALNQELFTLFMAICTSHRPFTNGSSRMDF